MKRKKASRAAAAFSAAGAADALRLRAEEIALKNSALTPENMAELSG